MHFVLQPWQLSVVILAGWINRQQREVIDYLRTENQVLKEKLGKKRTLLNDDQRKRLPSTRLKCRMWISAMRSEFASSAPFGKDAR